MRIVLAEDDLDDQDIFRQVIESHSDGVSLQVASNGETLVDLVRHLPDDQLPELIIADQNMPRLKGSEAILQLREHPRMASVPMVIYTTYEDDNFIRNCREANIDLYLKPDTYGKFKSLVDELVRKYST